MTLSAMLGKSAPPHEITITDGDEEVIYEAQRLGTRDWAKMSQIVYAKNLTALAVEKDVFGDAWFKKEHKILKKRYIEGDLSFESPEFRSFIQSTEGFTHVLMLIFGIEFKDVVRLIVCPERAQVTALVDIILAESLPAAPKIKKKSAAEMTADPGIADPKVQGDPPSGSQ